MSGQSSFVLDCFVLWVGFSVGFGFIGLIFLFGLVVTWMFD